MAVAGFGVDESVPLFRQWPQRFGQNNGLLYRDREFAGLRAKWLAANANNVAAIDEIDNTKRFAHRLCAKIQLDARRLIRHVGEDNFLSHTANRLGTGRHS